MSWQGLPFELCLNAEDVGFANLINIFGGSSQDLQVVKNHGEISIFQMAELHGLWMGTTYL